MRKTMTDTRATNTGKNIVLFSDGTGQEGGVGNNTNVYKLFNMIEDRTHAQVAFYDRGLGTGWRKLTGSAAGAGISKNILECYQFISDQYCWGDQIFLFGFSRGATTVRSLSGFISRFGILPHSRPELAKKAYGIYRISDQRKREAAAKDFLQRNSTTYCNIKFLGVWDTVSALGLPFAAVNAILDKIPWFKHSFHDLKLSPRVHHAYHALSIDDDRKLFHPTPWHTIGDDGNSMLGEIPINPRESDLEEQEKKDRRQTVKQVWFSGVHTDVGGGYAEHGVSDVALAWMADRAMEHGLKLYPFNGVELKQDIEDVIHDPRGNWRSRLLYRREDRSWDASRCGKPIIHASVLERKHGRRARGRIIHENDPYTPWILQDGAGEYDVEPWDNRDDLFKYGINIEHKYQSGYDARAG
jgi:uncharacterized protein (DUF2235 family)